jgi:hypothetical protein
MGQVLIDSYVVAEDFGSSTPLAAVGSAPANAFTTGVISNYGANGAVRRVVGSVYTDQAGTVQVQQSTDGVTWHNLGSAVAIVASTLETFDQVVYAPLTRVVLTNTASSVQTVLQFSVSTRPI